MMNPAIVVAAYNRPHSLARLLKSIADTDYTGYENIPLIISIDYSDCVEVSKIADEFVWKFGFKEVIKHENNIGLKGNILFCGDLSEQYGSVIVLEDDLFVSPLFYNYTCQAINFYENSDDISGISLYSYDFNEYAKMPFIPLHDGFDNYFIQSATSWGQAWNKQQWYQFKKWYKNNGSIPITQDDPVPETVIRWSERSWKKYFIKYMVLENKYFVIPRISLTTNFADIGHHMLRKISTYQVPLLMGYKKFNFCQLNESKAIYDTHYEINSFCLKKYNTDLTYIDFECDFYGTKNLNKVKSKHLLTIRNSVKSIASYSIALLPYELNIASSIYGNFLNLCKVDDCKNLDMKKKLFQYTSLAYDSGAKKWLMLFIYDIIKRIPLIKFKFW